MIIEGKFYQYFKKNAHSLWFTRLENTTALGTPDALVYGKSGHFFTIEFKVTKRYKLRFSPHQISFHVRHPYNSFILATTTARPDPILYEGHQIRELAARGLSVEPCAKGLAACIERLEKV